MKKGKDAENTLRVLAAFACSFFVISVFCPFLEATWTGWHVPEIVPGPETFWSFRGTYTRIDMNLGFIREERWFADYWDRWRLLLPAPLCWWIGLVLIFMVGAQILTVFFAVLAILKVKSYMLLLSGILNVFAIFCMLFVYVALDGDYTTSFLIGLWLTFPSAALFLVAFHEKKSMETVGFPTKVRPPGFEPGIAGLEGFHRG